jgi:hypothetical protein
VTQRALLHLPGYDVIEAFALPLGGRRRVVVQPSIVQSSIVQSSIVTRGSRTARGDIHEVQTWVEQQVRDIPVGGDTVEVVVRKGPHGLCRTSVRPAVVHPSGRAAERPSDCAPVPMPDPATKAANTAIKHIKGTGRRYLESAGNRGQLRMRRKGGGA